MYCDKCEYRFNCTFNGLVKTLCNDFNSDNNTQGAVITYEYKYGDKSIMPSITFKTRVIELKY